MKIHALLVPIIALFAAATTASAKDAAARPNIVFILIDDLGWADLGCYGSRFYETPHLDRLAAEGMRFTDAYAASPVCSPTRGSILTGKYPARTGITDWIPGLNPKTEVLEAISDLHDLPKNDVTLAEALKQAGYTTGFIGKWHVNETDTIGPTRHGFDRNVGGCQWGAPRGKGRYFSPWGFPEGANLPDGEPGEYLTHRLADEAAAFLKENKDKPFLLYWCGYTVHAPIQAPKQMVAKYEARLKEMPDPGRPREIQEHGFLDRNVQDHPTYAAMIETMDATVGRIIETLRLLGIDKKTAVIFTSDNGGFSVTFRNRTGPTCNRPLRAGKGWHYEGGIRVPLIVKWPGVTKPKSVCAEPVVSTDYYPTLLDIAGVSQRPAQHIDGLSLAPLLQGTKSQLDRDALFFHFPHYHGSGHKPSSAIRARDWKLIEFFESKKIELYNLANDLEEKNDLAGKEPARARELKAKLEAWRQNVGAIIPGPNPQAGKAGKPKGKGKSK